MGIIPARAGFTYYLESDGYGHKDHPRSRGVYGSRPSYSGSALGSSPLARGLPATDAWPEITIGIIPARAGFTHRQSPQGRGTPDHPRSRGVYEETTRRDPMPTGSSPLARGLPRQAGAGGDECLDHPRSRGVYPAVTAYGLRVGGSSPLARGLPGVELGPPSPEGIIPARAGFTLGHERQAGPPADHPRSRGVYRLPVRALNTRRGSSPLARGLRRVPQARIRQQGIIPARAGFTAGGASPPPAPGDHPRSRGVYSAVHRGMMRRGGSSPLARGLPAPVEGCRAPPRIIPARAGFTSTAYRRPT